MTLCGFTRRIPAGVVNFPLAEGSPCLPKLRHWLGSHPLARPLSDSRRLLPELYQDEDQ